MNEIEITPCCSVAFDLDFYKQVTKMSLYILHISCLYLRRPENITLINVHLPVAHFLESIIHNYAFIFFFYFYFLLLKSCLST